MESKRIGRQISFNLWTKFGIEETKKSIWKRIKNVIIYIKKFILFLSLKARSQNSTIEESKAENQKNQKLKQENQLLTQKVIIKKNT